MGSVNASNLWLFDTQFDTRKAITDNPSYTNQPYFTPDSLSLYYTQAIPMTPNTASVADTIANPQMDIYRYSLTEHQHTLLISSATSEYSPTPMPDGSGISTILVDSENKQWLWAHTKQGARTEKLIPQEPIGYHAWLDVDTVFAFLLGEPHHLILASTQHQETQLIAPDIGASMFVPNQQQGVIFTQQQGSEAQHRILFWDIYTQQTTLLGRLPEETQYFYLNGKDELIYAKDNTIVKQHFVGSALTPAKTLITRVCPENERPTRVALSNTGRYVVAVCALRPLVK